MILLSFIFTFGGSLVLCLAMPQSRKFWSRKLDQWVIRMLRFVGWVMLSLAAVFCCWVLGWALGLVTWFGVFAACTLVLTFSLPYVSDRVGTQARTLRRGSAASAVSTFRPPHDC